MEYTARVTVESDGFMITHGKLKPSEEEDESLYHLEKKYFVHKTSADLKKTIAILSGTYVVHLNNWGEPERAPH